MASKQLIRLDYEVFGRVQGVFFRKYTKAKGRELGLRGWVRNTDLGTVAGQLEGEPAQVAIMKEWLTHRGSPHSRIDKCNFKNEIVVECFSFNDFSVKS